MELYKIIEQIDGTGITHAFIKEGCLYFYSSERGLNNAISKAKNLYGVDANNEPKSCGPYGAIDASNAAYYTGATSMKRIVIPSKVENDKCYFTYDAANKCIRGRDKTDQYNEPTCYNKTTRRIQDCWEKLLDEFDNDTTMYQGSRLLTSAGLKMHTYCAVD